MKFSLLMVLLLTTAVGYAQDYVEYYSESYTLQKEKPGSYYSREIKRMGNKWIVKEFYTKNGSRKLDAECSEVKPALIYDGLVKVYDRGGNQSHEQICNKGKCKYIQVWANSSPILTNGSGVADEVTDNGTRRIADFRDSLLYTSFSKDPATRDTIYTVAEKTAEYPGGMEKFYQALQQKMEYPRSARKNREQGRVFVEFLVDKVGVIRNVRVLTGVSDALDTEAATKVPQVGSWLPGTVGGKPVKQRFVLPVTFRLP